MDCYVGTIGHPVDFMSDHFFHRLGLFSRWYFRHRADDIGCFAHGNAIRNQSDLVWYFPGAGGRDVTNNATGWF